MSSSRYGALVLVCRHCNFLRFSLRSMQLFTTPAHNSGNKQRNKYNNQINYAVEAARKCEIFVPMSFVFFLGFPYLENLWWPSMGMEIMEGLLDTCDGTSPASSCDKESGAKCLCRGAWRSFASFGDTSVFFCGALWLCFSEASCCSRCIRGHKSMNRLRSGFSLVSLCSDICSCPVPL